MINGINVVAYVIDACDGVPDVYGANVGVIAGLIVGVVVGDNVIGVLVAVFVGAMVRYEYDAYNYKMVVRTYIKLINIVNKLYQHHLEKNNNMRGSSKRKHSKAT
eukprot:420856_1